ncbi:MAG TPA: acyltransferase [Lacunisphaera sp.]|nr:acyltransferase [Lacunisphaera sp.]
MGDKTESRLVALDGLRGLAVLQVVLFHYYLLQPIEAGWYLRLRRLGTVVDGLTLFFVLSGFLIGGILLAQRDSPGLFRVFYWRRACRILPLYFLLLASYGAVRLIDQHWRIGFLPYWYSEFPFWNYLVFWQNERMVRDAALGASWLAVTWSLAVEMQFYLIAPWVMRFVSTRGLMVVGVGCVVAGPFLRAPQRDYLLADRMDALVVGVLLALFVRAPTGRAFLDRHRQGLRGVVWAYLLGMIALRWVGGESPILGSQTLAALSFAVWIALLTDGTAWPVMRRGIELLAPFGLWSYFLYLFHMPVQYVLGVLFPAGTVLALPVSCALAALSYRYLERPLIGWGHRQAYARPGPRVAAAELNPQVPV